MPARDPLTRDRIVAAAVVLADADGLDALSMRKLAAEIGYEPMSLYNHIDNKDDLLAAMVDADGLLGCLREAGFTVELAHHGYHAVDLYVVGTAQQQLTFAMPEDVEGAISEFLATTPEDEYPHLVEHVQYHVEEDTIADDDFDVLLDFILDGLERRAAAQ